MNQRNKGITLIALVILIIILLILAGLSIQILAGENGLLKKTASAKQTNEEATALEKIQVEVVGSFELNGKPTLSQLNQN